jgi:VanZ family protein
LKPVVLPELRWRRLWFSAGVAIALAIAVASLMPGRNLPNLNVSDKLQHFMAFTMLGFWFGSIVVRRDLPWLVIALLIFGCLIELAQEAMPFGRHAEWGDVIADGVGVLSGLLVAMTPLGRWAIWIETGLRGKRP